MVLVTGHRRENLGQGFEEICRSIRELSLRHPDIDIVYPVHLNPSVPTQVFSGLSNLSNVFLIGRLYPHFVALMRECTLILTDSGGVQEGAPSLGKPVLVMSETTERMEGVKAGDGPARWFGFYKDRIGRGGASLESSPVHADVSRGEPLWRWPGERADCEVPSAGAHRSGVIR